MSTEYASVDDLLVDEVSDNTTDVELPGGKVVKVRGLTRFELILSGKGTEDAAVIEQRNVSTCMIEPRMTAKQVEAWQKAKNPAALARITAAIRDLSGLGEGAGKSSVDPAGD